jgi:mRNA degradation ribonuclease J1/J2
MENIDTRLVARIINGVLALEDDRLTRALSFKEQSPLKSMLISHRHFDRIRDSLLLGFTFIENKKQIDIYAMYDRINYMLKTLMSGEIFLILLSGILHKMHKIDHYKKYEILDYSIQTSPVPHSVSASTFKVNNSYSTLFYTGDTG